jgi:glutamate dehydrogenase
VELAMPLDDLESLRAYLGAADRADQPVLRDFVLAYFSNTDPTELQTRGPAFLLAQAHAHLRLLQAQPSSSGARIRVFNPSLDEDGFVCENTVVQIIQDDMSFLVDSVTMAVNRHGQVAHWVVHPVLALARDAQGALLTARAADEQVAARAPVQSFISLECDRLVSAQERASLALELNQALADVKAAVGDWSAMLARLSGLREGACATALSSIAQQEGAEFLQWLEDQNFTFLGARDYVLHREGGQVLLQAVPDSGLGLLRGPVQTPVSEVPVEAQDFITSDQLVMVTKAMTRSTVHRPAWLDCVSVKRFDAQGQVVGESRFLGLYTSRAYAQSISGIPHLRRQVQHVMQAAKVIPDSHAAKTLQMIMESYPRDEMFQIDSATLAEHAIGMLRLQEGQRTRVFLRRDPFGRFTSALVFVPRERYNTDLRLRMADELMSVLHGSAVEFTPWLTENPMARIHFLVRARDTAPVNPDTAALEARIAYLARRWEDECKLMMVLRLGEREGLDLARRFANAFPSVYQSDYPGMVGAADALILSTLSDQEPLAINLYRTLDAAGSAIRLKLYSTVKVALSDALPVLENLGARVVDEQPYCIHARQPAQTLWIHDLGLALPVAVDFAGVQDRFEALLLQSWRGEVESDPLNKLVIVSELDAGEIAVLRAYLRYFKQIGFAFSQSYIEATLFKHAGIAHMLMQAFAARFNPALSEGRGQLLEASNAQLEAALAEVSNLDEDRILRQIHIAMQATLRTNAYQQAPDGLTKPYLSFKFNPRALAGVPEPRPMFEIWVYAPRFEGVHLRFGQVARGGLRWSDRREDFRTEILGLAKAQQVKNTVIVPAGSKGGFVLKSPPPASDREAWMAEGVACYRQFLSGLLDLTDNLVQGDVVPPQDVVRHDGDDPYLVVAADKGTATFSDIANSVSAAYGFWLGDAFASGGSQGYDHKKMGITARGAWESSKRHFRHLGIDTQRERFTVLGIGDMSGDVFGNGMRLSHHLALVLAFDHRHIFIDPNPDVARSFAERQRLFALPRSSWDDYDRSLLSEGGGIYPRSVKSIQLSAQACAVIGIEQQALSPTELLSAMLKAPVQLIYNGGIGTYVKASFESHAQVGNKGNDALRVDARDLRCKVFVEGGNLGLTQHARIEFARLGGRIYTDAIDNSAGVDCSDHEVNIKILLNHVVEAGDLTLKQRNELLAAMTDEVAALVLADNYAQTQALDAANYRPRYLIDGQQRLIQALESLGRLDRAIECLPTDEHIAQRKADGAGLSVPEGAVLLAYAKMWLFDELLQDDVLLDPYLAHLAHDYFPSLMRARFASAIEQHPLKREIIATCVANHMLNRLGATFVHFLASERAVGNAEVARACLLAQEIFEIKPLWAAVDALDGQVSSEVQLQLLAGISAVAQRATRWVMRAGPHPASMQTLIDRYRPAVQTLGEHLETLLPETLCQQWRQAGAGQTQTGPAAALMQRLHLYEHIYPSLFLVDMAQAMDRSLQQVAAAYYGVDEQLGLAAWREQVDRLPTDTLWQTQARASARDEVFATAVHITRTVLEQFDDAPSWAAQHEARLARLRQLLQTITSAPADLASIMVALRELRGLMTVPAPQA